MTQALGMAPGLSSLVVYRGLDRRGDLQLHGHAYAAVRAVELFMDLEPGGPEHRRSLLQGVRGAGPESLPGGWRRQEVDDVGNGFRDLPGRRCVCDIGGRNGSDHQRGGRTRGPLRPHGPTAAAAFRRISIAIPSWQLTAAAGCASCSQTYRNGPDVSANANFTYYVCADQTTCTANEYGGTSFAAPLWAGYMALVNQQAVANGNKALGFINPKPVYDWRGLELRHGFSRHHQRQQWLFGHNRLRSGHRLGQPQRERPA